MCTVCVETMLYTLLSGKQKVFIGINQRVVVSVGWGKGRQLDYTSHDMGAHKINDPQTHTQTMWTFSEYQYM